MTWCGNCRKTNFGVMHLELLPDEGTDGSGRSRQRQHQSSAPTWPWLPRHELSVAEGAALGRDQDRIPRSSESRVVCAFTQILVQSPKNGNVGFCGCLRGGSRIYQVV